MWKQPHGSDDGPQHGRRSPPDDREPCDIMPHLVSSMTHLDSISPVLNKLHNKVLAIIAFVFILLTAVPDTAWAQPSAGLTGRVIDQTGAVLPGVTVDLQVREITLTAATGGDGQFQFDAVPAGDAELTFRLLNFSVTRRTVSVVAGQSISPDVVMTLALNADVVVTGTRTFRNIVDIENPAENLVGIASAASQGAITAAQLEARPVMRAGEVLETVPGMIISRTVERARRTSTTSAGSTLITAPTSRPP